MEEFKESNQEDRLEKVKEYIIKMKEENPDYAEFLEIMYANESQGRGYGAVKGQYLGRYQLGDDTFEQIKFKGNGEWTELAHSLGVYNKDDFLKNETAQEVAVLFSIRWNYQYIVTNGDVRYDGTIIEEQINGKHYKVEVTISGLIAAEHLIGTRKLHKVFSGEKTWEDAKDEKGTNALKYMGSTLGNSIYNRHNLR